MMSYLERTFGRPDRTIKAPRPADFADLRGVIVVKGGGWGDARGHVTLWDGVRCSDSRHLLNDPGNGPLIPESASLWILR